MQISVRHNAGQGGGGRKGSKRAVKIPQTEIAPAEVAQRTLTHTIGSGAMRGRLSLFEPGNRFVVATHVQALETEIEQRRSLQIHIGLGAGQSQGMTEISV